jgi:hypothetical protein
MAGIRSTGLGYAFAALLLVASAAQAETDTNPSPGQSSTDPQSPAREGNVFDNRSHQPTQGELQSRGIAPPSASSRQQVDKEVQELLKQAAPTGTAPR